MKINSHKEGVTKVVADVVVVPVLEGQKDNSWVKKLPDKLKKEVSDCLHSKSIKGELGETRLVSTLGQIKAKNILLVGLGKEKELDLEVLRRAAATVLRTAKKLHLKSVSVPVVGKLKAHGVVRAVVEGALLADYVFDTFKTKKDKGKVEQLIILTDKKVDAAIEEGKIVAEATNYTRELVNLPAAVVTPTYLGKEALKLKGAKTSVTVYGKKDIQKMKMGGILGVSSGSNQDPRFIFIHYKGGGKKTIALVGKGVTFDAGGLNIKPTRYIEEMKQDMGGAAAVLGTIKAVKALGLKVNVMGVVPSAENLVGGDAYKPGDVLTAYNKKTIEVTNTDAEGRLLLADALSFAETKKPNIMIDIATLTGAVGVALGHSATGLLSKDGALVKGLIKAGIASGDRVWELPLWDDYKYIVKSEIADVSNSSFTREAGTIEGGMFLSNFVEKTSWAHLDIGGTAFFEKVHYYHPKGGTGAGVRLLVKYLEGN